MAEADRIVCEACKRNYAYKPELAGRMVRCACGASFAVPAGLNQANPDDDLLDFAPTVPEPPRPQVQRTSLNDAIKNRVGVIPGKTSETRERERLEAHRREIEQKYKPQVIRDTIIPIILLAIGIVLLFVEARHFATKPSSSYSGAIPIVLLRSVLAISLMVGGIFLAQLLGDVTFPQSLKQSALRLAAIAIAPAALYGMLCGMGDLAGPCLGVLASIVAYSVLFALLLKLDAKDIAVCVTTTWIMVSLANYAAFRAQGMLSNAWL